MAGRGAYEVILVDDCSRDATLERMHELAKGDGRIRVLHNEVNRGLGGAYKRGMGAARLEHVILVPGDNGFPAASLAAILDRAGSADIVIPYVVNQGARTRFRQIASSGFTTILNLLFGLSVRYYNGAVLHRTRLVQAIDIGTDGFAYQAEALVKLIAGGATYAHCPVTIQERVEGRSSALRLKTQLEVGRTILRLARTVGPLAARRPERIAPAPRRTNNP
jgi:glycosyltransferase involved in cell wall biosynthesis